MSESLKAHYVDHISIAVKDLNAAENDFKRAFGWEPDGRYTDEGERIRVVYFTVGPTAVELMEDLDGTGEVAKWIEKHGESVMVVSFKVDNTEQELGLLKRNGARLLDDKPRFATEINRFFAFLHPKVSHGVLMEVIDGRY
jgi:methylmalonyl-CoA/ethylmalonyl-CoA epimerase